MTDTKNCFRASAEDFKKIPGRPIACDECGIRNEELGIVKRQDLQD